MTEKKIATPEIARATWEAIDRPSLRVLEERLKSAGYETPSYRTLGKWQKKAAADGKPWVTFNRADFKKKDKAQRDRQNLDDAAATLTGDPRTKAKEVVEEAIKQLPPPEEPKAEQAKQSDGEKKDEAPEWLNDLADIIAGRASQETVLNRVTNDTLATAIFLQAIIRHTKPEIIQAQPLVFAEAHSKIASTLDDACAPLDRVGRAREEAMKTIGGIGPGGAPLNGEIIPPGADDPLADVLAAL